MPLRTSTPITRRPSQGGVPGAVAGRFGKPFGNFEQELANAVERALQGKLNNTAIVTLAVSPATTTDFDDPRIAAGSSVQFAAMTANAAAALATVFLTVTDGRVRFNHTASALADRTFRIAVFA